MCADRSVSVCNCRGVDKSAFYITCLQDVAGEDDTPFKDWILEKETELRLEVGEELNIEIQVRGILLKMYAGDVEAHCSYTAFILFYFCS